MNEAAGTREHDVIMTVREVADYLRVGESTVYRLARHRQLPGRKVGGAWRFSRRVVDAWMLNRGAGGDSPAPAVLEAVPDRAAPSDAPSPIPTTPITGEMEK